MSEDKKKSGKFVTTILIGGALGSVAALLFGRRKKKKSIAEKVEDILKTPKPPKKEKGFFGRLFNRCKRNKKS